MSRGLPPGADAALPAGPGPSVTNERYEKTAELAPTPEQRPSTPFQAAPLAEIAFAGARSPVVCSPVGRVAVASVVSRWRGELRVTSVAKATFAFAPDAEMVLI